MASSTEGYFEETYYEIFEDGFEESTELYYIEYDKVNGFSTMAIWFMTGGAVIAIGYAIYVVINSKKGNFDKEVKKYLQENPHISLSQLESDFKSAQNVGNDVYVGNRWTFYVQGHYIRLIDNKSIVWAYYYQRTGKYSASEVRTYNKNKRCTAIPVSSTCADIILQNYSRNQPHIVVGYDKEIEKVFNTDFNTFLSYRYNHEQQNQENNESNWEDRYNI